MSSGTYDENLVKTSNSGHQYKYTLNIIDRWENGGAQKLALQVGTNMEFEASQFLLAPPDGSRLNYYGTSYVYIIGQPDVVPFERGRSENKAGGSNDGKAMGNKALFGGDGTL